MATVQRVRPGRRQWLASFSTSNRLARSPFIFQLPAIRGVML